MKDGRASRFVPPPRRPLPRRRSTAAMKAILPITPRPNPLNVRAPSPRWQPRRFRPRPLPFNRKPRPPPFPRISRQVRPFLE